MTGFFSAHNSKLFGLKIVMIFGFLTVLPSAHAGGGDVIGNGGGQAELNADFVFENLERIYAPCLLASPGNACGLAESEFQIVQKMVKNLPLERQAGGLRFYSQPGTAECWKTQPQPGTTLHINSVCLYTSANQPKPFPQVASFVIAGLLSHYSSLSPKQLLPVSDKLTRTVPEKLEAASLAPFGIDLVVRVYALTTDQSYVTAEDTPQSYNLSERIQSEIVCKNSSVSSWRIILPQIESAKPPLVSGELRWQCSDGSRFQAVLLMTLPVQNISSAWILQTKQIKMDLVQIEEL